MIFNANDTEFVEYIILFLMLINLNMDFVKLIVKNLKITKNCEI